MARLVINQVRRIAKGFRLGILVVMCSFMAGTAFAQEVQDPTRPPMQLQDSGQAEGISTGPVLQSVLISPTRKLAMIDGVAVRLNQKIGQMTLVKITETEVVLRQGRNYQTLKLHPDFEKKPVHINRKSNSSAVRP